MVVTTLDPKTHESRKPKLTRMVSSELMIDPDDDDPDAHQDPGRADAAEALRRLLMWAVESGNYADAGRRVGILANALRVPGAPLSARELGRFLGVSHTEALRLRSRLPWQSLGFSGVPVPGGPRAR